uniref:Uncharacterized protein n=1 Tax=Astyanax mexicanus TaxID=7994 RepID=A0A8B9LU99_ASTMX
MRLPIGIFQQDNAHPHTITTLPWPTTLPDLSPIKHLKNQPGCQLRLRQPMNIQDLQAQLQHLWANVLRNPYKTCTSNCPTISHLVFRIMQSDTFCRNYFSNGRGVTRLI